MFLKLFLFIVLFNVSLSDNLFGDHFYANRKFEDIYTNHRNQDEVLKSYKDVYEGFPQGERKRNSRRSHHEKISTSSLEKNADLDRMDFHYPQVEFLTKSDNLESEYGEIEDGYTFLQSQSVVDNNQSQEYPRRRFPRLRNFTFHKYKPVRLSYVQKIPKPEKTIKNDLSKYDEITTEETETSNKNDHSKYAEISTGSSEEIQPTKKEKINILLKEYLAKLYSKKYNSSADSQEIHTNIQESSAESPENKLFTNNAWTQKKKNKINKIKKLFSIFTIVQFNNTQCNATNEVGSYLGVCYTAAECSNLGGTSLGNCANGFGVCCIFRGTCGGTSIQNCTYFESPNYPDYYPAGGGVIIPTTVAPTTVNPSPTPDPRLYWYFSNNDRARQIDDPALSCIFSVYKLDNTINKMRITFLDLELAGPTNGTCTIERLVITGQSANSIVPAICGYNTGQSILIDVSQSPGPVRLMVLATMAYKKRFRIMICQYSDTSLMDNCLQTYDGITGTISSFNYDQALMFNRSIPGYFNNLNYAICIRKAPGYCSITYTNVMNGVEYPFSLVNFVNGLSTVPIGRAGFDILDCPNDYIIISGTRLCGYKFNDGSVNTNLSLNAPVTDTSSGPIVIPVRTNSATVGYGFRLFYTQNRCPTS